MMLFACEKVKCARWAAVACCGGLLAAAPLPAQNALVRGQIIEHATGAPVAGVLVRMTPARLQTISDAQGQFYFMSVPNGTYQLTFEHLAYVVQTTPLHVNDADLNAVVRLTSQPVALEPIVVTVFSRRLERAGFYERERRGQGRFIDRKKIDALHAQYAVDLLRSVPEIRTLVRRNARNEITPRSAVGRNNCRFRYLLDGTRLLPDFELDALSPHVIEGLEIYLGMASVPADFRAYAADPTSAACGVIIVWMRQGS